MIIQEKYRIAWTANISCGGARVLQAASADAKPDEEVQVKIVIGTEQKMGKWPVYLDSTSGGNSALLGNIDSISNDDGALDDADILALAEGGNYKIVLKGPQGKQVEGELLILKDEASANAASVTETDDAIESLIREKVESGIIPENKARENVKYMRDNGVDNFLIKRVLLKWRAYDKPAHEPSCWYVDPDLESRRKLKQEGMIAEALRAAVDGFGIILEGEKSTGKNVFLETLARLLWMPLGLTTMTSEMSPASMYSEKTTDNSAAEELKAFDEKILAKAKELRQEIGIMKNRMQGKGRQEVNDYIHSLFSDEERHILAEAERFEKLKAQAASVNIVMEESDFLNRLQNGGMFVLNEMNMARANVLASFTNQLLDGTGFLFVPGRGRIDISPDFLLVATQNPDYAGTEMQNEATMSRFGCLYFRQPDSIKGQLMAAVGAALKKLGFDKAELSPKHYNEADAFYKHCRGAVAKGMVSNSVLNIRGFVRALTAVAASDGKTTLRRQVEIHVTNTCPFLERTAINQMAQTIISL